MATIDGMAIEISRLFTGSLPSFSAAGRLLFKNNSLILDNIPPTLQEPSLPGHGNCRKV